MIKKLSIKNFQSHIDTELNFSPSLNVIVPDPEESAANDIGKTSICRALQLVTTGRPTGFKYFPKHLKSGKVDISLELDNSSIQFTKTIKNKKAVDASYFLDDQEFRKFGSKVPLPIGESLNLGKNYYQDQHSKSFMIHDTPAEVTNTVNQACNIENSGLWVKNLTTKINTEKKILEQISSTIKDKEQQAEKYHSLDKTKELISELEVIKDQKDSLATEEINLIEYNQTINILGQDISKLRTISNGLSDYVQELEQVLNKQSELKEIITILNIVETIEHICKKDIHIIKESEAHFEILRGLYPKWASLSQEQALCNTYLNFKFSASGFINARSDFETLSSLVKAVQALREEKTYLNRNDFSYRAFDTSICSKKIEDLVQVISDRDRDHCLDELLENLSNNKADIKKLKLKVKRNDKKVKAAFKKIGVCPLCNHSTLNEVSV